MRRRSLSFVAALVAAVGLSSVALATSNYEYAPDEYVTVSEGLSPGGAYAVTAHGEGPSGYEKFHLYLTDANEGKNLGVLGEIGKPFLLDTGAGAYAARWSQDAHEVTILYRIDRHLPLKAVSYRVQNARPELIDGPSDASDEQIRYWQEHSSNPGPSPKTFHIAPGSSVNAPMLPVPPAESTRPTESSTPQAASSPIQVSSSDIHIPSEALVFQDLEYSKSFAEKNHLIAQVSLGGDSPSRFRFDAYPESRQISMDGVTYGKQSGEHWKKSRDMGRTGTAVSPSKNGELNFLESLATIFYQKPVSHDPTQGAYIWKKIKAWTNGDAQYTTFELSREHPRAGGAYPVYTFVKYQNTPDGQLLIRSCAGNTRVAGVLTPFTIDYDFLVPVNATVEVVKEPPSQQDVALLPAAPASSPPSTAAPQPKALPMHREMDSHPESSSAKTPLPSKLKLFGPRDKFPKEIVGCGLVGTFIPMQEDPDTGILVMAQGDQENPFARKFTVVNRHMGYPLGILIPEENRTPLHATRSHPLLIIGKDPFPGFYTVKAL